MSRQDTADQERKFPLDNPSDVGNDDRVSSGEKNEIDEDGLEPLENKEHRKDKKDDRHIAPTL
jgi:hypothetical protein